MWKRCSATAEARNIIKIANRCLTIEILSPHTTHHTTERENPQHKALFRMKLKWRRWRCMQDMLESVNWEPQSNANWFLLFINYDRAINLMQSILFFISPHPPKVFSSISIFSHFLSMIKMHACFNLRGKNLPNSSAWNFFILLILKIFKVKSCQFSVRQNLRCNFIWL